MATLVQISITDFKGIQHTTLEIETGKPQGRFITLIGLNESGKTTILEATALSALADEDTSNLFESVQGKPELNDIIPKRHKSSFSGEIKVELTVGLSTSDKESMTSYLRTHHNLVIAGGEEIPDQFVIRRVYIYQNSTYQKTATTYLRDCCSRRPVALCASRQVAKAGLAGRIGGHYTDLNGISHVGGSRAERRKCGSRKGTKARRRAASPKQPRPPRAAHFAGASRRQTQRASPADNNPLFFVPLCLRASPPFPPSSSAPSAPPREPNPSHPPPPCKIGLGLFYTRR